MMIRMSVDTLGIFEEGGLFGELPRVFYTDVPRAGPRITECSKCGHRPHPKPSIELLRARGLEPAVMPTSRIGYGYRVRSGCDYPPSTCNTECVTEEYCPHWMNVIETHLGPVSPSHDKLWNLSWQASVVRELTYATGDEAILSIFENYRSPSEVVADGELRVFGTMPTDPKLYTARYLGHCQRAFLRCSCGGHVWHTHDGADEWHLRCFLCLESRSMNKTYSVWTGPEIGSEMWTSHRATADDIDESKWLRMGGQVG